VYLFGNVLLYFAIDIIYRDLFATSIVLLLKCTLSGFAASSKLWGSGIFFKPQGGSDIPKEVCY